VRASHLETRAPIVDVQIRGVMRKAIGWGVVGG